MRSVAVVLAVAMLGVWVPGALACKYSVRDVGFVDLDGPTYRLLICVDKSTSAELAQTLRHIAGATFVDTNVQAEVVDVSEAEEAEKQLIAGFHLSRYPAAILVSPDGRRAIQVPLPTIDGASGKLSPDDEDAMWGAMEGVVISPRRHEIMGHVLEAHSVVLVIEGKDAAANERAKRVAEGAAAEIGASLERMAKPVERGPQVLTVTANQLEQERVLLWSLGLDVDGGRDINAEAVAGGDDAHIAVVFGRLRKLGSLLSGPGMTQTQLQMNLSYIGEDCECELDRSWMQGTMTPHRWDSGMQAAAYQVLHFDAEDALVKTEISRILARGPMTGGTGHAPSQAAAAGDALLGYSELVIGESGVEAGVGETGVPHEVAVAQVDEFLASLPPAPGAPPLTVASRGGGGPVLDATSIATVLGALAAVSVVGGVVVLMKARKAA